MSQNSQGERRAAFKIRYSEGDEPIPGYRLIKRLGQGGVGAVFKAVGPGGVAVALKIISGLDQAGGRKELRALQNVKNIGHANLVSIYGFWLKDEDGNIIEFNAEDEHLRDSSDSGATRPAQLFVVMRLCEGSLFDRFTEHRKKGLVGIPEEELIGYFEDAAKAIDYLNTRCNMQHCDIKPQNILIVGGTAQVCDYGLVKEVDDPHRSTNMVSPLYAAPELLPLSSREPGPTHATDQCSLAMSYVELRTGRLPFANSVNPDNAFQVMQAVAFGELDFSRLSEPERKVIVRATSKDPHARYESCVKMVRELQRAIEGSGTDPNSRADTRPMSPVAPYCERYQEGDEAVPGYKLIKRLGSETQEDLFLASARDGTTVALKIIYNLDEPNARRELQFLQKMRDIRHPYLVPVYGVWLKFQDGQLVDHPLTSDDSTKLVSASQQTARQAQVFVAVQPCEGNLRDRLFECQRGGDEGLPPDELAGYLEEASRAIDYLNRVHGIAHRDIKPQNIMLVGGVALVGNFGLARNPYDPRRSLDDQFPCYAAPELLPQSGLSGERASTPTSDLYSLAIMYIELRTGQLPFRIRVVGETLCEISEGRLDLTRLSPPEQKVIEVATAVDPGERYSSAVQMVRDLRAAIAEQARAEAQSKSGIRPKSAPRVETAPVQIKSPFKPRYEEGDEPLPDYKLVQRLGSAGIDEVFQAVGPGDVRLALKICYDLDEPEARAELRFLQRMASVRHPHLVAIDDMWLKDEDGVVVGPGQLGDDPLPELITSESRPPRMAQLFIAMPLCDGNLRDRLEETIRSGEPGIPNLELLGYMEESAKAVDFLNTVLGIQHCNLKPENILILGGVAQVGDISSTRSPLDERCPVAEQVPFYSPPELLPVSDVEPAPAATSDQYSLAMCYIELRTGSRPLATQSVVESMLAIAAGELDLVKLPEAEREILAQALSADPAARFASAATMVRSLRRAVEGAESGAARTTTTKSIHLKAPFQPRYAEEDEPIPGYRLLERLGASGFDELFRAAGPGAKKFALKIVYGLDEPGARREFRLLQRAKEMRHSHLVHIDEIWFKDGAGNVFDQNSLPEDPPPTEEPGQANQPGPAQVLFSMPLCECSLLELTQDFQKSGEKGIPGVDLVGYLEAAAKAIDHLNIVHDTPHGAIEPRHILILGGAICLSHFGLSKDRPLGKRLTEPQPPYYSAPELLAGEQPAAGNVRSDLYALAMSYVELSTGKLPFNSSDPAEVRRAAAAHELDLSQLPPAELPVIRKALARKPEKRFSSASEFVRALRPLIGIKDDPTMIEPEGQTPRIRFPIKNKYVQGDVPVPGHKLVELIGRGGFGDVWKATSPGGIREVALKIVYDAGGQLGQRELVGLWQIKRIKHENMVPIQALWIKDRQGDLVEDDQIAALEREVFAESEHSQAGLTKPKELPPLSAAKAGEKVAAAVKAPASKSTDTKKPAGTNGKTLVSARNADSGTIMFGHVPTNADDGPVNSVHSAETHLGRTLANDAPAHDTKRSFEPAQLFIAMELCDGHLLHRLNLCLEQGMAGIPPQELLAYTELAADVIDEFNLQHHTRHRDIKPQNLLTIGKTLKVCDFGLVRKSARTTAGQGLAFTPEYAAPEQVRGDDSPTTDQYCLAVTYAHLRTGRLPFTSTEKYDIIAGKKLSEAEYLAFLDLSRLKRPVRQVLQRALALDPLARYQSCKEFTAALREAEFPAPAPVRPPRRNWLATATAVMLLVLLGVLLPSGFLLFMRGQPIEAEGTIGTINGESLVLVEKSDPNHVVAEFAVGPETPIYIDDEPQLASALREGLWGTVRFVRGGVATSIRVHTPRPPEDLTNALNELVDADNVDRLTEAFDLASRDEQRWAAERLIAIRLRDRSKLVLEKPHQEIPPAALNLALQQSMLAVERLPKEPIARAMLKGVTKKLLEKAKFELENEQGGAARQSYEWVAQATLNDSGDADVQAWHREALLGQIRSLALREPKDLTEFGVLLSQFDKYVTEHKADLEPSDALLLKVLRLLLAAGISSPDITRMLLDLDATKGWRNGLSAWQEASINGVIIQALSAPGLSAQQRAGLERMGDANAVLDRIAQEIESEQFETARQSLAEISQKPDLSSDQLRRVKTLELSAKLKDPRTADDDVVLLIAEVLPTTVDNRQRKELCATLAWRDEKDPRWLNDNRLDKLLTAFHKVDKTLKQPEFLGCFSRLLEKRIIGRFAERALSYEDFTADVARHGEVQAVLSELGPQGESERANAFLVDACRAEELATRAAPNWSEVENLISSALPGLAGSPHAPYGKYVEAVVHFKSPNYADQERAPATILELHETPDLAWLGGQRRQQSAEILVAGAKRLFKDLSKAPLARQPIPATEADKALALLGKAQEIWPEELKNDDFNVYRKLALAYGTDRNLEAAYSAVQPLPAGAAADKSSARRIFRRHLLFIEALALGARANAEGKDLDSAAKSLQAFLQLQAELRSEGPLGREHYPVLIEPALRMAARFEPQKFAPLSDDVRPKLSQLYVAGGRLLRDDKELAANINQEDPTRVYQTARKWFQCAQQLTPQAALLTEEARLIKDFSPNEQEKRLEIKRLMSEALSHEDGQQSWGAHGLYGYALRQEAQSMGVGLKSIDLLDEAKRNFDEAIKLCGTNDPNFKSECYQERSLINLLLGNYVGSFRDRTPYLTQAEEDAREALRLNASANAYNSLGNALEDQAMFLGRTEKYGEAIKEFDNGANAELLERASALSLFHMGRCRLRHVLAEQARQRLEGGASASQDEVRQRQRDALVIAFNNLQLARDRLAPQESVPVPEIYVWQSIVKAESARLARTNEEASPQYKAAYDLARKGAELAKLHADPYWALWQDNLIKRARESGDTPAMERHAQEMFAAAKERRPGTRISLLYLQEAAEKLAQSRPKIEDRCATLEGLFGALGTRAEDEQLDQDREREWQVLVRLLTCKVALDAARATKRTREFVAEASLKNRCEKHANEALNICQEIRNKALAAIRESQANIVLGMIKFWEYQSIVSSGAVADVKVRGKQASDRLYLGARIVQDDWLESRVALAINLSSVNGDLLKGEKDENVVIRQKIARETNEVLKRFLPLVANQTKFRDIFREIIRSNNTILGAP